MFSKCSGFLGELYWFRIFDSYCAYMEIYCAYMEI